MKTMKTLAALLLLCLASLVCSGQEQDPCPGIDLADCSGMEVTLNIDNTRSQAPFGGINLANKSAKKISATINTSQRCPVPHINMRNTSATKIFIIDNNRGPNVGGQCPAITARDTSALNMSIRIGNRVCPTAASSADYPGYGRFKGINMKDCSAITIVANINSSQ